MIGATNKKRTVVGRPTFDDVNKEFEFIEASDNTGDQSKCLHCSKVKSRHTTRQAKHLARCLKYKEMMEEEDKTLPKAQNHAEYQEMPTEEKKKDEFHPEQIAWRKGDEVFWELIAPDHPELARIALRLLNTTTNSVPAERSFSILNLLHSKLHNRMGTEKGRKLVFIYMNARALRKAQATNWTKEDILELEARLIRIQQYLIDVVDTPEV
ncbi:hypothetical protein G7Y89_g8928 [Cudoniella acicularis]|uniref:HAT C-terminal dimerisation domain-containing protein n=1 Tax=Cudoniella acicularis TaxID=354080 RepID=A0A8H4RFN6_9HELO|nr:hypothetical protein G7Y89_g8928 [Cudoniella acicularis]